MEKNQRHKPKKKERFSYARKLYDSFTVKDMSFGEFERAYERETSPQNLRSELKELVRYRGQQRTQALLAAQSREQIDAQIQEN